MARKFVIVALSMSLVATLALLWLRPRSDRRPSRDTLRLDSVAGETWTALLSGGHRIGPARAPVLMVVFTDYECPYCREAERHLTAVRDEFPNELSIVYRHYPLRNTQPRSYEEARLAECAADEGRFQDAQAVLYESSADDPTSATDLASALGIQSERFSLCTTDTTRVAAVDADLSLIREIGTRRAPSIFLQGQLLSNTPDFLELRDLVQAALVNGDRAKATGDSMR